MYIALRTCVTNLEMNATAELISIGLVAETGETFYAERQKETYNGEYINDLVQETVIDRLKLIGPVDNVLTLESMRTKDTDKRIRERLLRWLKQFAAPGGRIPIIVQNPIDWIYFIRFLGSEDMIPDNIYEEPIIIQSFMFGKGLLPSYNPVQILNDYKIYSDIDKSLDALNEEYSSTALYDAVLLKFSFDYIRILTTPMPQAQPEGGEMEDIPVAEDAYEDRVHATEEFDKELEERLEEEYGGDSDYIPAEEGEN